MSTTRSSEKRKRGSYDPKEYQSAVYSAAGTVACPEEEIDEDDEDEDEEGQEGGEEHDVDSEQAAMERILQEQLRAEDEHQHARPIATPKRVRQSSRTLPSSLRTESSVPNARRVAIEAAVASNEVLAQAEEMLASEPKTEANKKRLATIWQARKGNDEVIGKAEVQAHSASRRHPQTRDEKGRGGVAQAVVTDTVGYVTIGAESGSESAEKEEEEEEEEEKPVMEEINVDGDVEIDWSAEEQDIVSPAPTTPRLHPGTRYTEERDTSTAVVEVSRLKHTPVTKQPRPRRNTSNSKHLTTTTRSPKPAHHQSTTNPKPHTTPIVPSLASPPREMDDPWSTLPSAQKWSTNPNLHARELCSATAIRTSLPHEPPYSFQETEISDGLLHLTSSIERFVLTLIPRGAHASHTFFDAGTGDTRVKTSFFESLAVETVKVVSYIASGGPSGVSGWHSLFVEKEKLQALVLGVVGNCVTEQVLRHAFFGGSEEGVAAVRGVEEEMRDADGEFELPCPEREREREREG
jgi:hypothetical protein